MSEPLELDVARFLRLFLEEATEHVATLENGLLTLERSPDDRELLDSVFRAAHSLKGGSGSVGLTEIARLTHGMESLLERMRTGGLSTTPALTSLLLRATDGLRGLLAAAADGRAVDADTGGLLHELEGALAQAQAGNEPAGKEAAGQPAAALAGTRELVVRFRPAPHLYARGQDPLLFLRELADAGEVQELTLDPARLPPLAEMDPELSYLAWSARLITEQTPEQLREIFAFVEDGSDIEVSAPAPRPVSAAEGPSGEPPAEARPRQPVESSTIRVAIDKVDRLINLVGELVIGQSMVSEIANRFSPDKLVRLQEAVAEMERNTRELQERVMAVRMVPVSAVFSRFPRLVRDLSATLGKQVSLQISGGDTELDKSVVERIGDPLTHLVRNCVDHGLEPPEERLRAGKPAQGTVKLTAFHQGGNVVIHVEDDGRGLDLTRIRQKAIKQGLVRADDDLTAEAVQALIFRPGFSTAEKITDVSGRGVGMDVVRTNIESLNGSVALDSQPGRGTRFRISLPLTLAIIDGLAVGLGEEAYIVPLVAIVESLRPRPDDLRTIAGRGQVICVRGQVLPLLRLRRIFGLPEPTQAGAEAIAVIIENQGQKVALLVDEILGQSQVVIKSLETNFRRVEGVMGATIMGDGRVGLILDVQGLTRSVSPNRAAALEGAARRLEA